MTEDTTAFAALLRASRRSVGLSQEELAARSGMSVRAIGNLERGRIRRPHPDSVRRLADALELHGRPRQVFLDATHRRPAQTADTAGPAAPDGRYVPRQLPPAVAHFVGRDRELARLTGLLDTGGRAGAVVISAISGMAGVGKTALALRWAHQMADRFPDGQLYLNLHGFDPSGQPVAPAAAIRSLLGGLGIVPARMPADTDAQASLYRSLLSGRRMLVVLDNARDAGQVRPLLPGGAGCLVLVTSRSVLSGLVAVEGAHALTLDPLSEAEAHELLARRLGPARLTAEPGPAAELARLCSGLPLALAVTAARVSVRPRIPLAVSVAELGDAGPRLDPLQTGDGLVSVRAVFSWSLASLRPAAARMFGLFGVHPGPDITVPAAASLAAVPSWQARRALNELAEAHLVTEHVPGRFGLHDLLRAYAAEQAAATGDAARRAALARGLDHYLHTASAAAALLKPTRQAVSLPPPEPGVTPQPLADRPQAVAWFEAEHQVLISAVALAVSAGLDACAWQLPLVMVNFLDWHGHWHEWAAVADTALAAATRLGDGAGQVLTARSLGAAWVKLGDYDQAHARMSDCLGHCRRLGDRMGEAKALQNLGWLSTQQGRHADALGYVEQALALFRADGDRLGCASALNSIGWCHVVLGRPERGRELCQQALAAYAELADANGQASVWDSLGYAEQHLGRLADAAESYRQALRLYRELGNRYLEADTLVHLGDTHRAVGQPAGARAAWQQALDILDELEHSDARQVRAKLSQLSLATAGKCP
jgi:tetratricopeptide (TPR) repeat protein/transcriptional regulator with XRE-family HTH domain